MTELQREGPSANGANPQASDVPHTEVNPSGESSVNPHGQNVNTAGVNPPATADRAVIADYLTEVFGGVPGLLQIWTMPAKGRGRFFSTDPAGVEAAADWCIKAQSISGQQSVYVRMTTLTGQPDEDTRGRGGADLSSHFLGLWTDLDFGTVGHQPGTKADSLPNPPDAGAAHRVYVESGLPDASILVNSGGGLYHVVLLDFPLSITDPEIRGRIAELSRRWHQHVGDTAKRLGYDYGTGVYDLARVLRVPGTVNSKDWDRQRPTSAMASGARYTLEQLEAFVPAPPAPIRDGSGRLINPDTGEILREARIVGRPEDGTLRPGDDFNDRADWKQDVLVPGGWQYSHNVGAVEYWTRPGKDVRAGHSASLNWVPERLWCWSPGDSGLEVRRAYDKWTAYACMVHGGNFTDAARDLAGRGYGAQARHVPIPSARQAEDMWGGQVAEDGSVIEGSALAEVVAPSMDLTRMIDVEPSEAELANRSNGRDKPPGGGGSGEGSEGDDGASEDAYALPVVDITNERDAQHNLVKEIANGALPETYIRDGKLVHVGVVSGARNGRRGMKGVASVRQAPDMTPSQMRTLIGDHMVTVGFTKEGPKSKLPTETLCKALLARTEWPTLPDLIGITPMPFVRPDGTVCQQRGYDPESGLWLNVDEGFPEVPEAPDELTVAKAYDLIVNEVLVDFPWVSDADRANFIALLLTPMLRLVTDCPSPLGVVTAAAAGSGKSILAALISRVFGGNGETSTLSRDDDETVKKFITSQLMNSLHPVVTFDNIGVGHTLDSPVLAQLMTSRVWRDRVLGGNDIVDLVNDKLWLVTGNNVRIGGDMASRSVFVRIDPRMERPDKRDTSKFAVGNLDIWLQSRDNRDRLAWALLVLVRAWSAAGSPKADIEMRTYTPWARAMGGLLAFHEISGFLTNAGEVDGADDESVEWEIFLGCWRRRFGERQITASELVSDYQRLRMELSFGNVADPWEGTFPVDAKGNPPTSKGMGRRLMYKKGAPKGDWVLRQDVPKGRSSVWYVEASDEAKEREAQEAAAQPTQTSLEDY